MNTKPIGQIISEHPSLVITIIIVYFGICGGLWHIGYWSTFEVNFLQYIDFVDVIKDFIFPFLMSCGMFMYLFIPICCIYYSNELKWGLDGKIIKYNKPYLFISIVGICFALSGFLYFSELQFKWRAIPFIISIPLGWSAVHYYVLLPSIKSKTLRMIIFSYIFFMPVSSFCLAKAQSEKTEISNSINMVIKIAFINSDNARLSSKFLGQTFLGNTSKHIFLLERKTGDVSTPFIELGLNWQFKYAD